MTDEVWADIPNYEGLYQVSNIGRVKSLPRGKQWPYRQTHNNIRVPHLKNGYLAVNLSKNNKVKWISIHRLVAIAFIPNPQNFPCVNHKDENKLNNNVDNLEWCTYKYNVNYGTGRERQRKSRSDNPYDYISRKIVGIKNSRAVRQLSPTGELISTYRSLAEASEQTGVHISTIIRHCKGKVGNDMNHPVRKYQFEYSDDLF